MLIKEPQPSYTTLCQFSKRKLCICNCLRLAKAIFSFNTLFRMVVHSYGTAALAFLKRIMSNFPGNPRSTTPDIHWSKYSRTASVSAADQRVNRRCRRVFSHRALAQALRKHC